MVCRVQIGLERTNLETTVDADEVMRLGRMGSSPVSFVTLCKSVPSYYVKGESGGGSAFDVPNILVQFLRLLLSYRCFVSFRFRPLSLSLWLLFLFPDCSCVVPAPSNCPTSIGPFFGSQQRYVYVCVCMVVTWC